MKVKDLLKLLEKQDPEKYIGRLDLGIDSGDYVDLRNDELIISDSPDEWYSVYGELLS